MQMRRQNRQVTDFNEIKKIVMDGKVARLGMNDEGKVYIVPMNYGAECGEDGSIAFYFHCAKVGRKIDILKNNPEVCLELDGRHELAEGETPCDYSYYFESLIGNGTVQFIEDKEEKIEALKLIMKHQTGKDFAEFDEKWVCAVMILKVNLSDYEVKRHNP